MHLASPYWRTKTGKGEINLATTIYKQYLRPKLEIINMVENLTRGKDKLTTVRVMEIRSLLEQRAEIETKLDVVNATTPCSNGRTIAFNLRLQNSLQQAANIALRNGNTSLHDSWTKEADELRACITEANNREK